MNSLQNKVIFITGSTSGIGQAIAKATLQAGAKIAIHGRSQQKLDECQQQLQQSAKQADSVLTIRANLSDHEDYQQLIDQVVTHYGRLDGLVNNAGISPRSDLDTINHAHFDEVINTNLRAPLFLTQQAWQYFSRHGNPGSIVNIGSINAHCGQKDLLAYSISKGALQTMTRNLADKLSHHQVRINQLNVGWTYTENENQLQLKAGRQPGWQHQVPKVSAPFGRILQTNEVAKHVIFWLSDDSYPVSGQVYEVEQYPLIGRTKLEES